MNKDYDNYDDDDNDLNKKIKRGRIKYLSGKCSMLTAHTQTGL